MAVHADQAARDRELLILVDADGREVGRATRGECHAPGGRRHRAFSVYLYDDQGRLLVQRRQSTKPLWPGFWSNSCCSHPRAGEDEADAARRRVREELGVEARLERRFAYEYRADYEGAGTEHEVVTVFTGRVDPDAVHADPEEVGEWRMMDPGALTTEIADEAHYTPWFRLAWPRLAHSPS